MEDARLCRVYTFANGGNAALPHVNYCKNGGCAALPHVNYCNGRWTAFVACKLFEMANRSFAACELLQKWRMRSFAACRRGHQVWHPADEKGKHDVTSPAL
jgi:hypothetical protein